MEGAGDPGLMGRILSQEPWLVAWVSWLMLVNTASLLFAWRHPEGRAALAAWLVNLPLMTVLYEHYGYVRLLGLSHLVVWVPLFAYLVPRFLRMAPEARRSPVGVWLALLLASDGVSLAIDLVEVLRYALGERAPIG